MTRSTLTGSSTLTRSRLRRALRFIAVAVIAAPALLAPNDAPAEWPPPLEATANDMAAGLHWPDDPGFGYSEGSKGQWNYYSFIPTQERGSLLRPEETASGMSIDLAWRYSQGDDSVRIAVMDSGIKWDDSELIDRAWLNPAELASHKPTNSDGSPCGGEGALEGFDCNDDGIFSVSDYAETPTLEPAAADGQVLGDINSNGLLDGGDIIINFSDGFDDDGNGYVDDISGWDFMKDDNNAYDDTRYGHGTGEAKDAVAEGNNGKGGIGGCPKCRFIPMRVGDSFIADVNAFGEAVIYATDNGARVVQCALGTINMNTFAQEALTYAYERGVLNVTSMADENARHHNMPATANHTLPVHAITFSPGNKVTKVETFVDFNTCTNYGGQNLLSVSGEGCSSEAVGQLSGMSGLLFSAALKYNLSPPLSAAEAMQLWFMTADDIDVPESREEGSTFYWSQPGFDQRFGYGRTNANTALEWVKAGKIPPEIDVVRPYWFEVLYADQLSDAVEIRGHISALRANSYDYVVEWAPGVQPLDGDYTEIASENNVPSDVITGSDDPLAVFDVRTIDVAHEADVDSPHGENQYTITVRVRAVAHYGGDIDDVEGEMRRTYYVHRDPDLVKGFPIYLGDSGESSAKLADIDGDGRRDLIYATSGGLIHVWSVTTQGPEKLDGFPFHGVLVDGLAEEPPLEGIPNYREAPAYKNGLVAPELAGGSFSGPPAVADLDDDGSPEIIATNYNGIIHVIDANGELKDGWPVRLPEVPSCPRDGTEPAGPCMSTEAIIDRGAFASPVIADMDNDGDLDIIQAAFDGKIYVYNSDGELLPNWPVHIRYNGDLTPDAPELGRVFTTPAVADFDGDGLPDLLVGSNEKLGEGEQSGAVYLVNGRGLDEGEAPWFDNWPMTMTSLNLFPLVAEGIPNSGVVGTFGGTLAAVVHGNASAPLIMPRDPGKQALLNQTPPNLLPEYTDPDTGETRLGLAPASQFGALSEAFRPNTMFPLFSQPSLGDVDQDGVLDVVASGSSLNLAINLQNGAGNLPGEHLLSVWSGATGKMLPAAPFVLEDYSFFNSHAIADLNGDDYPEVIAGSGGYYLHAFDGCRREPEGWPKFTGQWIIATPAVGDLDGDDKLEVVAGTRNGWL